MPPETPAERITRLEARLEEHERRLNEHDNNIGRIWTEFGKVEDAAREFARQVWDRFSGISRSYAVVLGSICAACVTLVITTWVVISQAGGG